MRESGVYVYMYTRVYARIVYAHVVYVQNVFSYRMCSLTDKYVLFLFYMVYACMCIQNVFSYYRMCSLTDKYVLLLYMVYAYQGAGAGIQAN